MSELHVKRLPRTCLKKHMAHSFRSCIEAVHHFGRLDCRRRSGQHRQARRAARFVAFCALALVGWGSQSARAEQPDFRVYARAVEFCRGVAKRPLALDLDRRVLCLDGPVWSGSDFSLAQRLEANGLFVVRSPGGEVPTAVPLANLIRERRATVVVYDYCFSACATFLLIASDETFVMKDTLVAWHHTSWPLCPWLETPNDGGPKRLEKSACPDTPAEYKRGLIASQKMTDEFYATRIVDPSFEEPPESFTIRRLLRSMFEGTGAYPDVLWTWNPRYYASTLKTKITYEAYPSSQDEVDVLTSKLPSRIRILYDP